jgi:hypothetical protein
MDLVLGEWHKIESKKYLRTAVPGRYPPKVPHQKLSSSVVRYHHDLHPHQQILHVWCIRESTEEEGVEIQEVH